MDEPQRPLPDRLAEVELRPLETELPAGTTVEDVLIEARQFPTARFSRLTIERGRLVRCDLSQTAADRIQLLEVELQHGSLANSQWPACRWHDVHAERVRMTGFNAAHSLWQRVAIVRCKLDLAVFHEVRFKQCRFENCDLREADFQAAQLDEVTFRNCDLRQARFPAARLQGLDLRGSTLTGAFFEPAALGGTLVDPGQVADIAGLLGLVVRGLSE